MLLMGLALALDGLFDGVLAMRRRSIHGTQRDNRRPVAYGGSAPPMVATAPPTPPPFSPSDISDLLAWFDLQDPASYTLNGGSTGITQILNKVSSQVYDTPVNDTPFEATGLNGHPCLHPSGVVGDRVQANEAAVATPFANTPNAITVAMYVSFDVADPVATLNYMVSCCNSASNNGSHSFGQSNTGSGRFIYRTVNDAAATVATESSAASVPSTSGQVSIWTLSAGTVSHFLNGAAADPNGSANNPGVTTVSRLSLFCKGDSTPDSPDAARAGEILIYGKVLDSTEQSQIVDYFTRWN